MLLVKLILGSPVAAELIVKVVASQVKPVDPPTAEVPDHTATCSATPVPVTVPDPLLLNVFQSVEVR